MVSCHETSIENRPSEDEKNALDVESSKTKEDDKVIANLQCLPPFFNIHEMLQLLEETRIALIQALENPSLYAIKIKETK